MSETSAAARDAGRCPSCGARVVPEQDWCSLCLQPLRAPAATDASDPSDQPDTSDPSAQPDRPVGETGVADDPDVPAEGTPGPVDPADPYASAAAAAPGVPPRPARDLPSPVAEAMLAELAASAAADRPLARGPLAGRSRTVRTLLGCGAALVLVGVVTVVLTLVGMLL